MGELTDRWQEAEQLGFDVVWNCYTVVEPDRPRHAMFDGPTTLTLMAATTSEIRVGTLVSSLYFRQPVTLAKATMTLDQLTGGRIELAHISRCIDHNRTNQRLRRPQPPHR